MADNWSGYPNGAIPQSMLVQVAASDGTRPAQYAQSDAAAAFRRIDAGFYSYFGKHIYVAEAFRNRAAQEFYRDQYLHHGGPPAAPLYTSKHGWALAFDLWSGLTSWTSREQAWWAANEAAYGFSSAQGKADGEPWHKVYIGPTPTIIPAGGGAVPIINPAEQETETMWVIGAKNGIGIDGAIFTIGPEYIRHETYAPGMPADKSGNPGQPYGVGFTTRVLAANDVIIWAEQQQLNAMLASMGIPADKVAGVLSANPDGTKGGKAWSRQTQIAAKLGLIPSEFVLNTY